MAYLTNTTASNTSLFAQLRGLFATAANRYKQHRVYRQTLEELSDLSNRELADLGLHRSDLRRVAMDAARA